jgi:hypothetical protein
MKQNKLIYFFSLLIVLYPILNRYRAPIIPFLTLSEFLLIPYYFLYFKNSNNKKSLFLILLSIYILINAFLSISSSPNIVDLIGTSFRLIFLYFSTSIFSFKFFDIKLAKSFLNTVSLVLSFYAITQFIFSFFNIYLTTYLPFLEIIGDINIDNQIIDQAFYGIQFRSRSFLNEPAHLATYLILPIFLNIFKDNKVKPTFSFLIMILALLASLSMTGIILLIILFTLAIFIRFKKIQIIAFFVFFIIIFSISFFSGIIFDFFSILLNTKIENFMDLLYSNTRFYQIFEVDYFPSFFKALFGHGLNELNVYLPSYFQIVFSFGIIGFFIYLLFLVNLLFKSQKTNKNLTIIFIFLNLGTEVLFGNFTIFYYPFIANKIPTNDTSMQFSKNTR